MIRQALNEGSQRKTQVKRSAGRNDPFSAFLQSSPFLCSNPYITAILPTSQKFSLAVMVPPFFVSLSLLVTSSIWRKSDKRTPYRTRTVRVTSLTHKLTRKKCIAYRNIWRGVQVRFIVRRRKTLESGITAKSFLWEKQHFSSAEKLCAISSATFYSNSRAY